MTTETEWHPKVEKLIRQNFSNAHGRQLRREVLLRGAAPGGIGGFDLDVIQMVMDLEDEFSIEITDAEDERLFTVGEVFDLIDRKLGEKP